MGRGKENAAKVKSKPAAVVILPGTTKNGQTKGAQQQPAKVKGAIPSTASPKAPKPEFTGRFEFTETVEANELASLAKKLKASTGKEPLLRALKRLAEVLESAPQDAEQLGKHGDSLASSLLALASDKSADKDVKLYSIQCMTFLLRMYAPETPYDDSQLKAVFHLLLWAWDRLSQPSLPTFPVVLSMLHVASETRLFLLMLDLEDTELVDGWATTLLAAPRPDSMDALEVPLQQVLCGLLDEGGSEVVSDTVLMALAKALAGMAAGGAAAQKLASRVLQRAEAVLRPRVQALLAELVSVGKDISGPLKQHVAPLMVQIQSVAPAVLLPVLPLLKLQLEAADQDVRRTVANWVTSLMTAPDCHSIAQSTDLTMVYLQRYIDTSVDVRLQMLEATKQLVADSTACMQEQSVLAAGERLDDREERVRCGAVKALTEVAASDRLELLAQPVLERLLARLLDKAVLVRKQAAEGLVLIFRHVAGVVAAAGCMPDTVHSCLMSIPARLAHGSRVDPYVRMHCQELMSSPGLMPAAGPAATPAGAALVWALSWTETDAAGQADLLRLLATKAELANRLLALLAVKRKLKAMALAGKENDGEVAAAAARESELHSLRRHLARQSDELLDVLLGPASAHDKSESHQKFKASLATLLEVKDLKVPERLAALCSPLISMDDARGPRKDVIERVGSKSPVGTFVRLLTAAILPTLITPATFLALAELSLPIKQRAPLRTAVEVGPSRAPTANGTRAFGAESPPPQVLAAAAHMLCVCSKSAPTVTVGLLPHMASAVLTNCEAGTTGDATLGNGAVKLGRQNYHAVRAAAAEPVGEGGGLELSLVVRDTQRLHAALCVMANSITRRLDVAKQGVKLDPLPPALVPCLRRLCLGGFPKAAALAAPLMIHLLSSGAAQTSEEQGTSRGARPAQAVAKELAAQCAACLTQEHVGRPAGLAAVHALSSIGVLAPDVFAEHVKTLVQHVLERVMYADPGAVATSSSGSGSVVPLAVGAGAHAPLPPRERQYQGHAPPQGGRVVAAKGMALRAVAKACSPPAQAGPVYPTTHEAVLTLTPVLEELVDVDTDLEGVAGVEGPEDAAELRLAAARALLTLSVRHDHRLPAKAWSVLALTLQDPCEAVRACFAAKLVAHVRMLHVTASGSGAVGGAWLPSKYAAMLPLAAVDPLESLRTSAALALRSYCTGKRAAAQQAAQQAALSGAAQPQAGSLQGLPEFMLPYLVYLLAAHPDCPDVPVSASQRKEAPSTVSVDVETGNTQSGAQEAQDMTADEEEVCGALGAFSRMLQMLLEPLLLLPAVGGGKGGSRGARSFKGAAAAAASAQAAQANYPLVHKLLTFTRVTKMIDPQDDGESSDVTAHMRTICDLGLAVARAVVERECAAAGLPAPGRPPAHPAHVVLPKNLFDCTHDKTKQDKTKPQHGDHLPRGFQVTLDAELSHTMALHAEPLGKPLARKRKTAGAPRAERRRRKQGSGSGGEAAESSEEGDSQGENITSSDEDSEARPAKGTGRITGAHATAPQRAAAKQPKADKAVTRQQPARAGRPTNLAQDDDEEMT